MNLQIRPVFVLLVLFCAAALLTAGILPAGVSIHRLDNGMEVLLIENRSLPMTGVNVVVKTGSAYESFATSGMSHMLEHLLFNGTSSRTQKQLYDQVDMIGGYNNANTSNFYTNYMMVTPHEHIKKGIKIQADMLFNSLLPADKFEKEKGIVLEEIARSINRADNQLEKNIHAALFPGHALSLPTLGTAATIRAMERDDVYNFYRNAYVPNNMIMSVVGNFDTAEMLKTIREIYGIYKPGVVSRSRMVEWKTGFQYAEAPPAMTYFRSYNGEEKRLDLFYPVAANMGGVHAELIDEVAGDKAEELESFLQKKYAGDFKSLEIGSWFTALRNYLHVSMVLTSEKDPEELAQATDKKMGSLDFSIPPETLVLKSTAARTNFLKRVEKPHMFGIYNAGILATGGIEAALQSYDKNQFIRAAADLTAMQTNEASIRILHFPVVKEKSLADQAKRGETTVFEDPETGLTLINSQNKDSELLAIHIMLKHRADFESRYGHKAAVILHDCLGQRLKKPGNQKLSNRFGFTYKVNDNPFIPMDDIYVHEDFSYIRAEGLADDIDNALAFLLGAFFGFEPSRPEYEKALQNTGRSKMMMGSQKGAELFKKTWQSVVYEKEKFPAAREKPDLERLQQFAAEYFAPQNVIISIVSPASSDEVKKIVLPVAAASKKKESPGAAAYQRAYNIFESPQTKELQAGGVRSYLLWGFSKTIEPADKPALTALSLLLSDKIVFDIREKQGRAYRMRAGIDIIGSTALFFVRLGTRPENIDALLPQMQSFFSQKTVDEFTAQDLQKSVNMYLGRMMFRRLSSINRAYYLAHSLYFENDINHDMDFLAKLGQVSLEDVQKVAQKYMRIDNPATVVVR